MLRRGCSFMVEGRASPYVGGVDQRIDMHDGGSWRAKLAADLAAVLLVRDVLHPFDVLAVEGLLQGDVHHRGVGGGAVPVLLAGRNPYRVAGPDFADRSTPELDPSYAEHDVQGLPER